MRPVFAVPEPERRRVGNEDLRDRFPKNLRRRTFADRDLARRRICRPVYWLGPKEYAAEPERPATVTPPTSSTSPSSGVQPPGCSLPPGAGVVVAEHVVDRHAEKRNDVLQVSERQVAAGDDGFNARRVIIQARTVEQLLHPVADAEDLHPLCSTNDLSRCNLCIEEILHLRGC